MATTIIERARLLALRAHAHLATARLRLDMVLDGAPESFISTELRSVQAELTSAQEAVQAIMAGALAKISPTVLSRIRPD